MPESPRRPLDRLPRRELLAGAAALAGLTTVGLLPGTASAAGRQPPGAARGPVPTPGDTAVTTRVSARRALRHLRVLSDDIGWRVTGTRREHRAAHYIAGTLRDLGYTVELQPFSVPDKKLAELRAGGEHWQSAAATLGAAGRAKGRVTDLGEATEVTADLTGRIALFTRVPGKEQAQAQAAAAKGARAVLIVNVRSTTYPERKAATFFPALEAPVQVPVLGLAEHHGELIREGVRALSLEVTAHTGLTSHNVIAERRATRPNPGGRAVIVGAHYDSVPGSPGGNDDGSGTALCLELARATRRLPTQQDLRFCLWGAEELGLVGARHYVKGLDDAAAARITGCFQNDMVATSHPAADTYWLLSVDGKPNTTTTAIAGVAERLGYTGRTKGPAARGSSDHEAFHERGIAAGNFSWRGEAPSQLEPVYHTPEDTVEGNISLERLQISLELIGCAAYDVALNG
ncbi:M28 family peptidase [Actinomadura sp. NEAU-AAG7]|uniref:M28 family peptidase n=1 Tax=Actinomadura sp. NEAU-AAG7 TaxID=2839640 RepID=UPI001BE41B30|nr:M28 family peptidase [Actinomadura sp. NEAU-AAG7]MBT2213115.1 M28 family peptidase [Actinomadura sp. NEAU-AAG7]